MRVLVALVALCLVFGLSVVTALQSPDLHHTLASWPADSVMPLLAVDPALVQTAHIEAFDEPEAPQSLAEVRGDAEQQAEAETESETETAVQGEQETEATAETETAAETEVATDAAAETEATAEVEQQAEGQAEAEAATETESAVEADAESGASAESATDAEAEVEAQAEAEFAAAAAVQAEGELAAEAQALADAEAETAAVTQNLAAHGLDAEMLTEAESAVDAQGYLGVAWTSQVKGSGCGSGVTSYLVPDWNMRPACDAHDRCYDVCGSRKQNCDATFYSNMKNLCARRYAGNSLAKKAGRRVCEGQAFLYYQAVVKFGGGPFSRAQAASKCPK